MTKTKFTRVTLPILALIYGLWLTGASASLAAPAEDDVAPGRTLAQQATKTKQLWITSDHSKHEILQQEFTSGPEVTKACLSCHNQAALQFHETIHWTWRDPSTEDNLKLGKGGLSVNNF
jgi:hypothetical protein